jgi:putative cardiolipin synthase
MTAHRARSSWVTCWRAALVLAIAFLAGCATLPPGSDFPKTVSSALAQPEETRLGRQFADAARSRAGNSAFRMVSAGIDGFLARAQMINAAERTLDIQYFIFRSDETGKLLTDAMLRAADRGVRVRLLIDDGERRAGDEQVNALDAHPAIEVRMFNPFAYRGASILLRGLEFVLNRPRLNYRMHNKVMIVDNAISLIGGRNVGDEYFQMDPEMQFADDEVFAAGPVVRKLSDSFDEFWNSPLAIPVQALAERTASAAALAKFRSVLAGHREQLKADAKTDVKTQVIDYAGRVSKGEPLAGMLSGRLPLAWAQSVLVYDGPEKRREKEGVIGKLMPRAVAEAVAATRTELLMVTPYLIPGEEGMQLFESLRKQQVRVRILTNSLESSNVLVAHSGYMGYRLPLLERGVEISEVRSLLGNTAGSGQSAAISRFGTYSLHAKLFVFDRRRLYVGSMNFDQRSMHLNTEIGLIIESPELARQSVARFEAMASLPNSYEVKLLEQDGAPARLVWRTEESGKPVEYVQEPARSDGQRLAANLLRLLPLDDEL